MGNGKHFGLSPEQRLIEQLSDPEYRRAFVEGHASDSIAFQLQAMRRARGWEQREVAEKLGNPRLQPMISRYENPDYGKYSISTLLELATIFDVALAVRFVPFSELVEWDLSLNPSKECPAPFKEDAMLRKFANGMTATSQSSISSDEFLMQNLSQGAARTASPQDLGSSLGPIAEGMGQQGGGWAKIA
jgi:transcriptional regulator with XRE-family HTH domain